MNDLFLALGIQQLKPLVTAFLLPPVPFLIVGLLATAIVVRRRRAGVVVLTISLVMTWLSGCLGMADAVAPLLLDIPPPLSAQRLAELRAMNRSPVAIIVLGGGVEEWAPEYRRSSLAFRSLERLRYGIWLGRQIGWPTGFSGGIGWGQAAGRTSDAEATVAQRIATEEYGRPLRWVEATSRDTHENADHTIALLKKDRIAHVLLVTHWWHMPRSARNLRRAAAGLPLQIEMAPIGLAPDTSRPIMRWIPSSEGVMRMREVFREWLGWVNGA